MKFYILLMLSLVTLTVSAQSYSGTLAANIHINGESIPLMPEGVMHIRPQFQTIEIPVRVHESGLVHTHSLRQDLFANFFTPNFFSRDGALVNIYSVTPMPRHLIEIYGQQFYINQHLRLGCHQYRLNNAVSLQGQSRLPGGMTALATKSYPRGLSRHVQLRALSHSIQPLFVRNLTLKVCK